MYSVTIFSLQENWDELTALCNESLNPDQDLTCQESTKEALALLTSSEFQNHICKPEPMVLNCFLNNVVGTCITLNNQLCNKLYC